MSKDFFLIFGYHNMQLAYQIILLLCLICLSPMIVSRPHVQLSVDAPARRRQKPNSAGLVGNQQRQSGSSVSNNGRKPPLGRAFNNGHVQQSRGASRNNFGAENQRNPNRAPPGGTQPGGRGVPFPQSWGITLDMMGPGTNMKRKIPISSQIMQFNTSYEEIDSQLDQWEYPVPFPYKLKNLYGDSKAEDRDFLYFLHIPKTAGQAFHSVLSFYFQKNNILNTLSEQRPDLNFASPECNEFNFCKHRSAHDRIMPRMDHTFAASGIAEKLKGDFKLSRSFINPWDIVVGHMDISLTKVVAPRRTVIITFVRNPVDRFYSFYNFLHSMAIGTNECVKKLNQMKMKNRGLLNIEESEANSTTYGREILSTSMKPAQETKPQRKVNRRKSGSRYESCNDRNMEIVNKLNLDTPEKMYAHKLKEIESSRKHLMITLGAIPYQYPLEEFLQLVIDIKQDNYMTRAFSGTMAFSYFGNGDEISDDKKLQLAMKAMDRFAFVGDTSHYEKSVELFYFTFNLPFDKRRAASLAKTKRNVSGSKVRGDAALDAKVLAVNRQDEVVYARGAEIFQERYDKMLKMQESADYSKPTADFKTDEDAARVIGKETLVSIIDRT